MIAAAWNAPVSGSHDACTEGLSCYSPSAWPAQDAEPEEPLASLGRSLVQYGREDYGSIFWGAPSVHHADVQYVTCE